MRSGGCVFVHCGRGISRSATVVMAYLMQTRNLDVSAAFSMVASKRPCCYPNIGFQIQLHLFEKTRKICCMNHKPKPANQLFFFGFYSSLRRSQYLYLESNVETVTINSLLNLNPKSLIPNWRKIEYSKFNLECELVIWIKRKLRDVKGLLEAQLVYLLSPSLYPVPPYLSSQVDPSLKAVYEDEQLLEDEVRLGLRFEAYGRKFALSFD